MQDDAYFLQTSRYIHLNPAKAGLVAHPEDYQWSSYRTMIGMQDDRITQIGRTHAYFETLEGQPMITIIGLGDLSVKEAAEESSP